MSQNPSTLIDALGGTSALARLLNVRPQSVHSWRTDGIPSARIQTLQALAMARADIAKALKRAGYKPLMEV
jgi:DNA-binding transcriptional regulator YdaS (Cro superfamily)